MDTKPDVDKSEEISQSRNHGAKMNEYKSLNSTESNRAHGTVTSPGAGLHRQPGASMRRPLKNMSMCCREGIGRHARTARKLVTDP